GGSSDSETSDETVSPARRPSTSATTTDTPAGHRRKSARCSAPRSCTDAEPRDKSVSAALAVAELRDLRVQLEVERLVVRSRRGALPHHVGRDAGAFDGRAVAHPLAGRMRAVRVERVTEH